MTKKLEELFNVEPTEVISPVNISTPPTIDLEA